MKYVKIIGVIILIIWIIFVIVDCIRINNSGNDLKPLITIIERNYDSEWEYDREYIGLGYAVRHTRSKTTAGSSTIVYMFYVFTLPYVIYE